MGTTANLVNTIGENFRSTVSFARPANTTPYTALDVIGNASSAIHEFANISRAGGHVQITSAAMTIANTSIPTGMTSFRLHLYDVAPTTAILDNAAFTTNAAGRPDYRGSINFTITLIGAGFLYADADYIGRALQTTTENLFGVLQTIGGYTPASGTAYSVTLNAVELG